MDMAAKKTRRIGMIERHWMVVVVAMFSFSCLIGSVFLSYSFSVLYIMFLTLKGNSMMGRNVEKKKYKHKTHKKQRTRNSPDTKL